MTNSQLSTWSGSRRALLAGPLLAGLALSSATAADAHDEELQRALAALEQRHGGRLGVAVLDTAGMKLITHRGDDRFLLCSTYKCLAAAFVLARVDRKQESLARPIAYTKDQLLAYSPITGKRVAEGSMSLGELCEAAVTVSDNTAGNLLLDSFGGPAELTAYTRSLGDDVTRLDRREPELNEFNPGDLRDTTSPAAMASILYETVLGNALSAPSREQLTAWLIANKTGEKRLRAELPKGWRVGDRTGAGAHNATNDIAVIWPPGRAPIVVTAYYMEAHASDNERNAVLSEVGRLVAA